MYKSLLIAPAVLLIAVTWVSPTHAQSITASRPSVDIAPEGGQCFVGTCIEATAMRTGICAVEVIDNSGSMNTNGRFAAAKAGISQFVDSLRSERGDLIGLVTFNGPSLMFGGTPQPNSGLPAIVKQVEPVSQAFESVKATVNGIQTSNVSSLTPLAAGIEAGAEVLAGCPDTSAPVMIVVTDGLPNWNDDVQCSVTPLAATSCTDAAVEAASEAKRAGIHIVTMGIDLNPADPSEAFGISLLRDVASSPTEANVFNTADGFGQAEIFAHIAGSVASPNDVRFTEPLPDSCWSYVLGSTTGSITDEPFVVSEDGELAVSWSLGTLPDRETAGICYDMIYDQRCGASPSMVEVQPGGSASWIKADGSTDTVAIGSQTLMNIAECRVSVPVELVDFHATSRGRDVTLAWSTASELNNAGFGVERWTGRGEFEQIEFVVGHGTSAVPHTYRYVDTDAVPGRHRYRLRQTDLDGAFVFSPTVEVNVEVPESHFMSQVYPNPLRNEAAFDFSVARTQNVRIDLIDATGRMVRSIRNGRFGEGLPETIHFDAGDIPAGIYVVRVTGEYFTATRLAAVVR